MRALKRSNSKLRTTLVSCCLLGTTMIAAAPLNAAITIDSDPILFWNDVALTVLPGGAPAQTRAYAMVNIAMYDAVNSAFGRPHHNYLTGVTGFGGDSRAAASQAAHDVLVALNPANAASYASALSASLALVGNGASKTNGIATGAAYAAAILAQRTGDGSTAVVPYTTTGLPGDWRQTPPGFASPAVPQWGDVKSFVLSSGDAVRPGPPPALTTAEYAAAYNEVKEIGSATSITRTADQTASALFWDNAAGGPWMRIGLLIAEDEGLNTLQLASNFALLSTGLADSIIAGFDSKYEYRLWRPVTAIQLGDTDGNAATVADATWSSLFPAPAHPSFISTHSALSGVGSTILTDLFGDDEGFTVTIAGDTRSFTGLNQAALDGANSRLWGGIHFRFDNDAGLAMGREIGARALRSSVFKAVPETSTWTMLMVGFAAIGTGLRRRPRQATASSCS